MPPVDADADGSSFAFLESAIANPTRLKMFGIGYCVPGIIFFKLVVISAVILKAFMGQNLILWDELFLKVLMGQNLILWDELFLKVLLG